MTKENFANTDHRRKPDKKNEDLKFGDPRDTQGGAYDSDLGAPNEMPEGLTRERKGPLSRSTGRL